MAFLLPFLLQLYSTTLLLVFIFDVTQLVTRQYFMTWKDVTPWKQKLFPSNFFILTTRALPPFNYLAVIFDGIIFIKIKRQINDISKIKFLSQLQTKQFPKQQTQTYYFFDYKGSENKYFSPQANRTTTMTNDR